MTDDATADFESFVRARAMGLQRAAYLLVGDAGLAQDLVQIVLTSIGIRWARVSRADNLEAYVRTTMVRQAVSLGRKRQRWNRELPWTTAAEQTVAIPTDSVTHLALMDALRALPTKQRCVIVLRYYEDLTEREIADALDCAPGTVKSQAAKALESLRAALGHTRMEWADD